MGWLWIRGQGLKPNKKRKVVWRKLWVCLSKCLLYYFTAPGVCIDTLFYSFRIYTFLPVYIHVLQEPNPLGTISVKQCVPERCSREEARKLLEGRAARRARQFADPDCMFRLTVPHPVLINEEPIAYAFAPSTEREQLGWLSAINRAAG